MNKAAKIDSQITKSFAEMGFLMKRLLSLLLFLALTCCGASVCAEDSNQETTRRILESWTNYLRSWNNTAVEYDEIITASGEEFLNVHYEVVYCHPNVIQITRPNKVGETPYPATSYETITVINPRYSFKLSKKPDETDWVIDSVQQNEPTQNPKAPLDFPDDHSNQRYRGKNRPLLEEIVVQAFARGLTVPPGDWLPDVFAQNEFEIVDVQKTENAEESTVNVQYDYRPTAKRQNQLLRGGTLNLTPEHFWALKNGTVVLEDFEGSVDAEIECEYDFTAENAPRLLRHRVRLVQHDQTIERRYSNYRKVDDFDKKSFYLSGYQFPEPDFGEKPANRLRVIVIVAGLLLIGFGARRIYRKRDKK